MRDLPTNDGLLPILWWYNDDIMGIYIEINDDLWGLFVGKCWYNNHISRMDLNIVYELDGGLPSDSKLPSERTQYR